MRSMLLYSATFSLFIMQLDFAQSSIEQKSIASLKNLFGDTVSVSQEVVLLTQAEKDSLAHRAISTWLTDSIRAYICRSNGNTIGYGFVDDVKGKTQYITYLTVLRTNGEVQDIDVLAYRESYGGEIAYESFRKQFRTKALGDKLQPGKDIKNISGATISVRAITAGVKKILSTFDLIRPRLEK